jgi:hypothetical protein
VAHQHQLVPLRDDVARPGQRPHCRPQPGYRSLAPLGEIHRVERLVLEDHDAAPPDQVVDPALVLVRADALGEDHRRRACGRGLGRLEDRHAAGGAADLSGAHPGVAPLAAARAVRRLRRWRDRP